MWKVLLVAGVFGLGLVACCTRRPVPPGEALRFRSAVPLTSDAEALLRYAETSTLLSIDDLVLKRANRIPEQRRHGIGPIPKVAGHSRGGVTGRETVRVRGWVRMDFDTETGDLVVLLNSVNIELDDELVREDSLTPTMDSANVSALGESVFCRVAGHVRDQFVPIAGGPLWQPRNPVLGVTWSRWYYRWVRMHGTFRYYYDLAGVTVHDRYGLDTWMMNYFSTPPDSTAVLVTKEHAIRLALEGITTARPRWEASDQPLDHVTGIKAAELWIVNPNWWYADRVGGSREAKDLPTNSSTRLAWVCEMELDIETRKQFEGDRPTIWIDAATGEVLGGDMHPGF